MTLIPPDTLELIRSRLDIVELVGESVALTRAGRNMKARCPFHQEKSPSFIVSPERQTFHCFGCGEGGDAFSFVMKIDGLSFSEAAERLAQRVGVKIEANRELGPQEKERIKIREANEFAAEHYFNILRSDAGANAAREYASSRGLSPQSVEEFRLGFAPRTASLVPAALKKGFSAELLVKAGLAVKRSDGSLRDYFFDRLLFPIRDAKGSYIGFGGRTLGDGEPKYLNTSESPVFSKGKVLYGLYEGLSETRKKRSALIMEGYMDVITAHQHGLKTACAPLGTALTAEQAVLLKRYCDGVTIMFDADAAGQSAAVRGAEVVLESGLAVGVSSIPEGKDPDEFLRARGAEALRSVIEGAVDLAAFKTELLIKRAGALTPETKSSIAKDVLATIIRCPDEILKDEWVRRLAGRLGVNEDSLRRAGGKAVALKNHSSTPKAAAPAPKLGQKDVPSADLLLLGLLVKAPGESASVETGDLASETGRTLLAAICGAAPYDGHWGARWLEAVEPELRPIASRLLVDELGYDDAAQTLRDVLGKRRAQKRLKEIEPLLLSGGRPADLGLRDEFQRLVAQLKGTKR